MKRRFATEGWWFGSLSLLILSNLVLLFWIASEKFGWAYKYNHSQFIFYVTFFPGMFIAPVAALIGIMAAMDFLKTGQWVRTAVLSFLCGGAALCAFIAWNAFLTGGR